MVEVSPSFVVFQLAYIESRELVHADCRDTNKPMSCVHKPNNRLENKTPDARIPTLHTEYEVKTTKHNSLWLRISRWNSSLRRISAS